MSGWLMEAAGKAAEAAVNRLFSWSPSKKDQPPPIISPSLAVGYFYNFLEVVSREIDSANFGFREEDGPQVEVSPENVAIQIILPAKLDNDAFKRCNQEFRDTKKGQVFLHGQGRWYGVNYRSVTGGKSTSITLIDLARPIMSLRKYYSEILKINVEPENSEWNRIQYEEIAAFEKTLRRLQKIGFEGLSNILDFRPIG